MPTTLTYGFVYTTGLAGDPIIHSFLDVAGYGVQLKDGKITCVKNKKGVTLTDYYQSEDGGKRNVKTAKIYLSNNVNQNRTLKKMDGKLEECAKAGKYPNNHFGACDAFAIACGATAAEIYEQLQELDEDYAKKIKKEVFGIEPVFEKGEKDDTKKK
eukprot:m.35860 g.35860  ORF g.35860 m.35860 type:complete len:157 (-) comp17217_c0_seq1:454-924(-)